MGGGAFALKEKEYFLFKKIGCFYFKQKISLKKY